MLALGSVPAPATDVAPAPLRVASEGARETSITWSGGRMVPPPEVTLITSGGPPPIPTPSAST